MPTSTDFTLWGLLIMLLGAVQPEAAAGAVCGGLFFWSLSPEIPVSSRFWLAVASIGFGYGMALPAARLDNGWEWILAVLGASLAHVLIVSMRGMIKSGSPLPPWLRAIVDALPWTKTRGGDPE